MDSKSKTLFTMFALMLLCSAGFAATQNISGYVHDTKGVVLSGATVICKNASMTNSSTTSATGYYTMLYYWDGDYQCNATKVIGQARQSTNASITVTVSGNTSQNFTMASSHYENSYASTDVPLITIDAIGTILVFIIATATLIGIGFVWKFFKGKKVF